MKYHTPHNSDENDVSFSIFAVPELIILHTEPTQVINSDMNDINIQNNQIFHQILMWDVLNNICVYKISICFWMYLMYLFFIRLI